MSSKQGGTYAVDSYVGIFFCLTVGGIVETSFPAVRFTIAGIPIITAGPNRVTQGNSQNNTQEERLEVSHCVQQ